MTLTNAPVPPDVLLTLTPNRAVVLTAVVCTETATNTVMLVSSHALVNATDSPPGVWLYVPDVVVPLTPGALYVTSDGRHPLNDPTTTHSEPNLTSPTRSPGRAHTPPKALTGIATLDPSNRTISRLS